MAHVNKPYGMSVLGEGLERGTWAAALHDTQMYGSGHIGCASHRVVARCALPSAAALYPENGVLCAACRESRYYGTSCSLVLIRNPERALTRPIGLQITHFTTYRHKFYLAPPSPLCPCVEW